MCAHAAFICVFVFKFVKTRVWVSRSLREISEQGHDLASTAGLSVCLVSVTMAMVLCRQDVYIGDFEVITSLLL